MGDRRNQVGDRVSACLGFSIACAVEVGKVRTRDRLDGWFTEGFDTADLKEVTTLHREAIDPQLPSEPYSPVIIAIIWIFF